MHLLSLFGTRISINAELNAQAHSLATRCGKHSAGGTCVRTRLCVCCSNRRRRHCNAPVHGQLSLTLLSSKPKPLLKMSALRFVKNVRSVAATRIATSVRSMATFPSMSWSDPLDMASMLTEDEKMVQASLCSRIELNDADSRCQADLMYRPSLRNPPHRFRSLRVLSAENCARLRSGLPDAPCVDGQSKRGV